ncbi:MAG: signal peptidase I [Fervidicoccaceae archaeon]
MSNISKKDVITIAIFLALIILIRPALALATGTETPIAVVRGNSMLPLLREGDIVFLHHATPQEIRIGDIIVYKSVNDGYIIHRVVKIVNTSNGIFYVTKGDNNPVDDSILGQFINGPGISYDRVVGVVWSPMNETFVIPIIGIISLII